MKHQNWCLRICLKAFLLAVLSGCTVNIYHHQQGEGLPEVSVTTDLPGTAETKTIKPIRTGSASADEIMWIRTSPLEPVFATDQTLALDVVLTVDAYVSCFYQQGSNDFIKLFPNRLAPDDRVKSGQLLHIPRANGFRQQAASTREPESFMCFASSENVTPLLPTALRENRFQQIPVNDFDELYNVFRESTRENLVARVVQINPAAD